MVRTTVVNPVSVQRHTAKETHHKHVKTVEKFSDCPGHQGYEPSLFSFHFFHFNWLLTSPTKLGSLVDFIH